MALKPGTNPALAKRFQDIAAQGGVTDELRQSNPHLARAYEASSGKVNQFQGSPMQNRHQTGGVVGPMQNQPMVQRGGPAPPLQQGGGQLESLQQALASQKGMNGGMGMRVGTPTGGPMQMGGPMQPGNNGPMRPPEQPGLPVGGPRPGGNSGPFMPQGMPQGNQGPMRPPPQPGLPAGPPGGGQGQGGNDAYLRQMFAQLQQRPQQSGGMSQNPFQSHLPPQQMPQQGPIAQPYPGGGGGMQPTMAPPLMGGGGGMGNAMPAPQPVGGLQWGGPQMQQQGGPMGPAPWGMDYASLMQRLQGR